MRPVTRVFAIAMVALSLPSARAADSPSLSDPLYSGWLKMYDLRFDEAHQIFAQFRQSRTSDPMGFVSDAAAYLFSELARLGALESELFTDDSKFLNQKQLTPDPRARQLFAQQMEQADRLTASSLQKNPVDPAALFAKALSFGLRADYAALVDHQYLSAVSYTKDARSIAEKLLVVNPLAFDGYVGPGVEHYLLSLKSAPLRLLLRLTGSHIDAEQGLAEVRQTALHGRYLEPFAKLLLAVAALRDKQPDAARKILTELRDRFPHNDLYVRELNRLPH
ncbi:MAG: hypothetical protein ABI824_11870 [Acidobacteriota bacterium]